MRVSVPLFSFLPVERKFLCVPSRLFPCHVVVSCRTRFSVSLPDLVLWRGQKVARD